MPGSLKGPCRRLSPSSLSQLSRETTESLGRSLFAACGTSRVTCPGCADVAEPALLDTQSLVFALQTVCFSPHISSCTRAYRSAPAFINRLEFQSSACQTKTHKVFLYGFRYLSYAIDPRRQRAPRCVPAAVLAPPFYVARVRSKGNDANWNDEWTRAASRSNKGNAG